LELSAARGARMAASHIRRFRSADWLESCFFVFPFKKSHKVPGKNEARKEVSTLWFKSEQQVHPKDKVDDRVLKAKRRTFGYGGGEVLRTLGRALTKRSLDVDCCFGLFVFLRDYTTDQLRLVFFGLSTCVVRRWSCRWVSFFPSCLFLFRGGQGWATTACSPRWWPT
jgi:hypothetical protein